MSQTTCVVVVSDTHCNSKRGLCPPGPIPLKDGAKYTPNILQEQLWDWWLDFWRSLPECDEWWLVLNGDLVDGVHPRAHQIIRPSVSFQTELAVECLEQGMAQAKVPPKHIFGTRGTPYHTGEESDQDTLVMQRLPNVFNDPANDSESWWHLKFDLHGHLFDVRHKPVTFTLVAGNTTAAAGRLSHRIWEARALGGRAIPDVAIRSHVHVKCDSGYNPPRPRAITTPCWKMGVDDYVSKIGIEHEPSMGGLFLMARPGQPVEVIPKTYALKEDPICRP